LGQAQDYARFKREHWVDPIGAAYLQWDKLNNKQRVQLMLQTWIDLTVRGYRMPTVWRAFLEVREFEALGYKALTWFGDHYPMTETAHV
jgi:hypothetical protein